MRVLLVIKGNTVDAFAEGNKRGVHVIKAHLIRFDEMVCEANSDADTLNRWFTEDKACDDEGNFPPGSLLFWSAIDESEK